MCFAGKDEPSSYTCTTCEQPFSSACFCCNMPRILMASESTLRVSAEVHSRHAWELLREWVQIAPLSPPCMASISQREAHSTCCATQLWRDGPPLREGRFPLRRLSLALHPAITWEHSSHGAPEPGGTGFGHPPPECLRQGAAPQPHTHGSPSLWTSLVGWGAGW